MKNKKTNPTKTAFIITVGFAVLFLGTKSNWALIVALTVGLVGIFSPYLSRKVDYLWMKLGWLLSWIVPNIILGIIFYVVVFPMAILSRVFGKKDPVLLKNNRSSIFQECNKEFDKASFEKPW